MTNVSFSGYRIETMPSAGPQVLELKLMVVFYIKS